MTQSRETSGLLGATPGVDIPEAIEAGVRPAPPLLGSESGLDFEALVLDFREVTERAWTEYKTQRRALSARRFDALERGEDAAVAWDVYRVGRDSALDVRDAALRGALDALQEAVQSDPLAAWIMANVSEGDQDEMLAVLEELPCSPDCLDELAADHGWCDVWEEYRSRAIAEGLVPGARS